MLFGTAWALATRPNPLHWRILLAEDSLVNQKVAVALLEKWGHTVTVVGDGSEAITAAGSQKFDLVLMDVKCPK